MKKYHFLISLISVICLAAVSVLSTPSADANGAVWNPGSFPGTPGPVKKEDLILLEEHVVFEGLVSAEFLIRNPTNKDIQVTMGFPLKFMGKDQGDQSREEFLAEFSKDFEVYVDGARVAAKPIADGAGLYSVVYIWEMTFPAMKTVTYTVEYPLTPSVAAKDAFGYDDDETLFGSEETKHSSILHTQAHIGLSRSGKRHSNIAIKL